MSEPKSEKRRRALWIRQSGRCYYCRCDTVLLSHDPERTKPPDNMATIEHLIGRLDPRYRMHDPRPVVMACFRCNTDRGSVIDAAYRLLRKIEKRKRLAKKETKAFAAGILSSLG